MPDSAKSAAFYSAIFGGPVWKNNQTERRYVMLGPCYIAIEQGRQPMGVDHFSVGIDAFDINALHAYLKRQGIAYRDYPSGRDLNVTDADGIHAQLSADNTWSQLKGATASPVPGTDHGEAIFRPLGLDHILLNVADPEASAVLYAKIFGPITQRNNGRIWFQTGRSRVGLLKTPAGQTAGVNHFCVSAAPFDYAVVTRETYGGECEGGDARTRRRTRIPRCRRVADSGSGRRIAAALKNHSRACVKLRNGGTPATRSPALPADVKLRAGRKPGGSPEGLPHKIFAVARRPRAVWFTRNSRQINGGGWGNCDEYRDIVVSC